MEKIFYVALLLGILPTALLEITTEKIEEHIHTENKHKMKKGTAEGWSEWSSWRVCSRSCNGGVTYQLRKCNRKTGCGGETIKYMICNMQPCGDRSDFRATQCSAYDNIAYRGTLYTWLPFYDPEDPCSLTCQARSYNFVVKLAPKVQDGTRCREGVLDMCVDGKCLPVGCDLKLGSSQKVDQCGVCGGDGSTCRKPVYDWSESQYSPCSVTCGGGYQTSRAICKNKETDKEVDEGYCNISHRPRPKIRECNLHKCPAIWVTENWSPCSTTCGEGRQKRTAFCVQGSVNGSRIPISSTYCTTLKPTTERKCKVKDCPRWFEGPWSGCSTSCGQGFQVRTVICKDGDGETSDLCNNTIMPIRKKQCNSGINCNLEDDNESSEVSQEDSPLPTSLSLGYWERKEQVPSFMASYPSYVAGEWGHCSVTCGAGVRWRHVVCQIFLEFSRTVAPLPDRECRGDKPAEFERCYSQPCTLDQNNLPPNNIPGRGIIKVTYSWRMAGSTPCSASCRGGVRESIIQCIRDYDFAVVSPYMCDLDTKPLTKTVPCNEHPCPPRWNTTTYNACSKTCGGGLQSREVTCVLEDIIASPKLTIMANSKCPQPPPRSQQYCNVFDCPPKWHLEAWSKCSKSCGGGVQTRKIKCQKEMAFGQTIDLSPSDCTDKRPRTTKACNKKSCEDFIIEDTTLDPETKPMFIQEKPSRKVLLEAKGTAVIYQDTIVKLRCPGINATPSTVVVWYKNGKRLEPIGKYSVSRRGALKVRKISDDDAAIYTCVAGKVKSDINITIKPLPSGPGTSQETKIVERPTSTLSPRIGGDYGHEYTRHLSSLQIHPPIAEEYPSSERVDHNAWRYHHSQDIISDQNSGEMNVLSPHSTSRVAQRPNIVRNRTRSFPFLNRLLTNLRRQQQESSGASGLRKETNGNSRSTAVGRETTEGLEFDWMVTEWTSCSQSCGGGGTQMRATQCLVRLQNVSKIVDNNLCLNNDMPRPSAIQKCGLDECPHWETGHWTDCLEANCFSWNTALQKRDIYCRLSNGTDVEPNKCEERMRPRRKRECFNDKCKGMWKVSEWSQCTVTCGPNGFQTRVLQCVWNDTNKIAGNACQDLPRPIVIIPCDKPPCPHNDLCVDRITYCDVVKKMNVCHLATYRQLCCYTCRNA